MARLSKWHVLPFLYHIHENITNSQNCKNNHIVLIAVSCRAPCCVIASTHRVVRCVTVLFCHFDAALSHCVFVVVTPCPIVQRVVDCCILLPGASCCVVAMSRLVVRRFVLSHPDLLYRVSSSHCVVMLSFPCRDASSHSLASCWLLYPVAGCVTSSQRPILLSVVLSHPAPSRIALHLVIPLCFHVTHHVVPLLHLAALFPCHDASSLRPASRWLLSPVARHVASSCGFVVPYNALDSYPISRIKVQQC